ncbi:MAG: hypothetical protein RL186_736, partial [Pseudomonadota bacterium]
MRVLAIDTALQACSVALLDGADVLVRAVERMDRGQAERLAPMVQSCLAQAKLRPNEIDCIAVT